MPARKRLALALAVLGGVALLGLAAWLAADGRPGAGAALGLATAAAALAARQAVWVSFDLTGRSLRRGPPGTRAVALTFDDGPSGDTPAVLAALDRAGVRATFFVLGEAARRAPERVRELARRGHLVALHGDTHAKLLLAGPRRVAAELDRCADAIRAAGVEPAPLFRAPHGFRGPFLGPALRRRGLTLVGWTRGVFDTERPGAEVIAARASRRMRPGEILLLHDGCATPGIDPRRDQTAEAVPEIVRRWREAGYAFVTLDAFAAPRAAAGGAGAAARGGA
jgi:peptidoglycan/xylan/chitin deacetylase (PgdA/CDA1 family)